MNKRIKLALLPLLFSIAGWAFPQSAQAQFLGYTSPQTTTSYPFGSTLTSCTGSAQVSAVNNIQNVGQSAHFAFITQGGSVVNGTMVIQGSNDGLNYSNISEIVTIAGLSNPFAVGTGYYNFVRINVNCAVGGSFIVQYSGTSVASGVLLGTQQSAQYDKVIAGGAGVSAQSSFTSQSIQPPFGSTSGFLTVFYNGTAPTASTIQVVCSPNISFTGDQSNVFSMVVPNTGFTNSGVFQFVVPPIGCHFLTVNYAAGTGGSASLSIDYLFTMPGLLSNANSWAHITGTTATEVKASSGMLHTLAVNTAAAGTVSIFDLPSGSCTATPTINPVAVITVATTGQFTYDAFFSQGICIKASVAMDLTATFN